MLLQGTLIPSMYITAEWNRHMDCMLHAISIHSTILFPTQYYPPSVRQSPAPNILPCVYVADGKGDAWIDFLLIAIFDCCKSMVPSDVTFSISDDAGIVVLTFYKYFTQCELTSNTQSCFIANIVEGRAGISGARLLSTIYRDGTSSNDGLYSFCFS